MEQKAPPGPIAIEAIQLVKATPSDAVALAEISGRAFDHDIHYGAPGPGGPPGYRSDLWQRRMMLAGDYYKIVVFGRTVGGTIVLRKRPRDYELARIFVAPEYQNRGLGTGVFGLLDREYPLAQRWILGTPAWNRRTRHFYKKVGFVEIRRDGRGGILLEKVIQPPAQ